MFRIFVSSTFNDLKLERNALQIKVFSKLRELCLKHGYRFQAIDLRFGVRDEAALDQQTMRICLDEIKRCQQISPMPNFLVLLGDRYGWRPLRPEIPDSDFAAMLIHAETHKDELNEEIEKFNSGLSDLIIKKIGGEKSGPVIEALPRGIFELLNHWYRRDNNALCPAIGDSGSGPQYEPLWILQPRTGKNAVYADREIWEKVEKKLACIIREATGKLEAARRIYYNISATALEIIEGAFKNIKDSRKHVFCYLRKISNIAELKRSHDEDGEESRQELTQAYIDTDENFDIDEEACAMQEALKKSLHKALPGNIFEYESGWDGETVTTGHIGRMCNDVYRAFAKVIMDKISNEREIGPLDKEIINHEIFLDERSKNFAGRSEYLKIIGDYINDEDGWDFKKDKILALYGKGGSGKSSLMSRAILNEAAKADNSIDRQLIYRFLGRTPDSSNLRSLLDSLCDEIARCYGLDAAEASPDTSESIKKFNIMLKIASEESPLTIFLDSLDQLSLDDNAYELKWLPSELPENVHIVVSTLDMTSDDKGFMAREASEVNRFFDSLKNTLPSENLIELKKMPVAEGGVLLDSWLFNAARSLTERQRELILQKFEKNGRPLYLKLAFEEARRWRSYDVPESIHLSDDITGIIDDLFSRLSLETNHGEMVVSRAIGYIAAARNGISEDELLDVLAKDAEFYNYIKNSAHHELPETENSARRIPITIWSRLFFDIMPYLTERMADGAPLMSFFHRHFALVAKRRYLSGEIMKKRHRVMAGYFMEQPLHIEKEGGARSINLRKCSELLHQLRNAGMHVETEKYLTDLDFIEAKCKAKMTHDLVMDYEAVNAGSRHQGPPIITARSHEGKLGLHCVFCNCWFEAKKDEIGRELKCLHCEGIIKANSFTVSALWRPALPDRNKLLETGGAAPSKPNAGTDFTPMIHEFSDFVRSNAHVLVKNPLLTYQMAANDPEGLPQSKQATDRMGGRKFIRRLNKTMDKSNCLMTLAGHTSCVTCCAISADGSFILSASEDKTLKLWDAKSGMEVKTFSGHSKRITSCAISDDSSTIISASKEENKLKIWDIKTGRELKTFALQNSLVSCCAISPDGSKIVSASYDHNLMIWDARSGRAIKTLTGHDGAVKNCVFTPDGSKIVSTSEFDYTLKIWCAISGTELHTLAGHTSVINSFAVSPDSSLIVSASWDHSLKTWSARSGKEINTFTGHADIVKFCAVLPDGSMMLSASEDKTIKIWDIASAAMIWEYYVGGSVNSVSFSRDGKRISCIDEGGNLHSMELVNFDK